MPEMKRTLLIFLFISVCCNVFAQTKGVVNGFLPDAVSSFNAQDYDGAKQKLLQLAKLDPENDAVHYYLGMSNFYLSRIQEAELELKEAVRLDPDNYWYRDRLAVLYSVTGRTELTIDIYEQLIKDFPKKTDIYFQLASLYAETGQRDKMLETIGEIETMMGKTENTTLIRYQLVSSLGKDDEAFGILTDFVEEYDSPQILTVMGDIKLSDYEDSTALGYYDEALSLDSSYPPAMLGKAEVYRMRRSYGDYFPVIREFMSDVTVDPREKSNYLTGLFRSADPRFVQNFRPQIDSLVECCIEVSPNDSTTLQAASSYYYNTNRPELAEEYFRRNVELYPESYTTRVLYVQFLALIEDWERLVNESEKGFETFPDELAFIEMKNTAYYNLQDYEGVIRESERLISLAPKDTSVLLRAYSSIGDMYSTMGDIGKAYKYYDKALIVNPDYAPVLNNYAYYLSTERKKLGKAYKMSKKTVEQEPDNATYLDTFGWILHLQGKSKDAKVFFKRAMLYGGKESEVIIEHYAKVLDAIGESDLAKVYYNMLESKRK